MATSTTQESSFDDFGRSFSERRRQATGRNLERCSFEVPACCWPLKSGTLDLDTPDRDLLQGFAMSRYLTVLLQ